jgi:hypothetical protein
MTRWQPIETAPRDGSDVLVLLDIATVWVAHIAFYRSEEEWEESGQYCWDEGLDDWLGWWSYTQGSVSQEKLDDYRTPRYWMPLPELPK